MQPSASEEWTDSDDIREAGEARYQRQQLDFRVEAWLRREGWKHTSDTPGCFWMWQRALPDGRVVLVERAMAISLTEHWPELPTDAGTGEPSGPCVHCKEIGPLAEVDHWERCPAHPARLMVDSLRAQLAEMGKTVDRLNEEANHWHGVARNTSADAGTGAVTSGEAADLMQLADEWLVNNTGDTDEPYRTKLVELLRNAVARERERVVGAIIDAYNEKKFNGRRKEFDEADIRDAAKPVTSGADAPGAGTP